jgi:nucleotide-binding universal stress UspA family protein
VYRNVVVGVNGKENGRDAIMLAEMLRNSPASKVTLAHVRRPFGPALAISNIGDWADEHDSSQDLLEQEREAMNVDAKLLPYVASSPGKGLHEVAEKLEADLLVVGSCSRGGLERTMLRDDARATMNGAPCAVAIAGCGLAPNKTELKTIGAAYNGSPESAAAVSAARDLANASAAEVLVLEVVAASSYGLSSVTSGEVIQETIEAMTEEAEQRLEKLEGVTSRAVYGSPREKLEEFSRELQLLVVGSRGNGPARRLLLGSTSSYLERHSHCSLLILLRPE